VPYEENIAIAVINNGKAIVRVNDYIGLGIDELNLSAILPENHKIISENNMQSMATAIADYKSINLLQGDFFQKKSKQFAIGNLWRISAYLSAAFIALLFLNPIISNFILNNASKKINIQIADIYKRNFPNAKNIVAPKERMQDKLQKITGSLTQNHWLLLLAYLSDGVQKTKGIQIKKVDYQNSLMSVDVVADSSMHFENLMSDLASQGLTVKQQNASVTPTRVEALLTIE
jgi:type II secretion system protein L